MGYQKTPGAGTFGGGSKGYRKGGGYGGYGSSKGFCGSGGSGSSGGSGELDFGSHSERIVIRKSHQSAKLTLCWTLKDICRSDRSTASKQVFGGKVVLFGGDFRQILPVIPNSSRQDVVHATINSSYLWEHFTVLKLTVNMRLGGKNDGESTVEFPDNMLIPESDDHEDEGVKINTCLGFYFVVDADDTNFNLDLYTTDFLNTINVVSSATMSGIAPPETRTHVGGYDEYT
ncbi:ATP-dependent DNA helicase PIF1-like protein [Tanacetum coccineum]